MAEIEQQFGWQLAGVKTVGAATRYPLATSQEVLERLSSAYGHTTYALKLEQKFYERPLTKYFAANHAWNRAKQRKGKSAARRAFYWLRVMHHWARKMGFGDTLPFALKPGVRP